MEKKRVEYIKMMYNRKEKKGFFEKNKDTLGGLVSMFTLLGIVYTIFVVLFRYIYSEMAADFYRVERSLFNQDDLALAIGLSSVLILHLFWAWLPFLPFQITRANSNLEQNTTSNDESGKVIQWLKEQANRIVLIAFMLALDWLCTEYFISLLQIEDFKLIRWVIIILRMLGFIGFQVFRFTPKKSDKVDCWLYVLIVIFVITESLIAISFWYNVQQNINLLYPSNKKTYEIVQTISSSNLKEDVTLNISDSSLQVVILHTGSQVVLMNGSLRKNTNGIDETIEADRSNEITIEKFHEIASSSTLYLDTGYYKVQDADKYNFYRIEFHDVKPKSSPQKNDKQGE